MTNRIIGVGSPRNHHTVPRHYLKGFTETSRSTHLWVFTRGAAFRPGHRRGSNNPYRSPITRTAVTRDFYVRNTLEGKKDRCVIERILQDKEQVGRRILKTLRTRDPISDEEKLLFSDYIVLMMKRVPDRFRRAQIRAEQLARQFPWDELATLAAHEGRFDVASTLVQGRTGATQRFSRDLLLRTMVSSSSVLVRALGSMTWRFLVADGTPGFLTSDSPVCWPRELGLGKRQSFFLFPLSTRVALFGANVDAGDCQFEDASVGQIEIINRLVLRGADSEAYYHRPDRWPLDLWAH